MLLESNDDFVHVLSVKGLFLYASSHSCGKMLEYQTNELIGHNISEYVHPADIISLMRSLRIKTSINVACRFRRKLSGYIHVELHGHFYQGESGKRNKCFVLSGRERSLGSLKSSKILSPIISCDDCWCKISPQGLLLHVSSNADKHFGVNSYQSLVARSMLDFIEDSAVTPLVNILNMVSTSGEPHTFRATLRLDPQSGPLLIRFYPGSQQLPSQQILAQIRLIHPEPADKEDLILTLYEQDIFDFIHPAKPSSLHYELNRLRITNKKLKEELHHLLLPSLGTN